MNKYDFIDTNKYIDENKIKDFNTIYNSCKQLADNKSCIELNMMFTEELSELIQPIIKLERWEIGDEFLRCNYIDIIENIYEEISDVIIMLLQFVYKYDIDYKKLTDNISAKILRIYETKFGKK